MLLQQRPEISSELGVFAVFMVIVIILTIGLFMKFLISTLRTHERMQLQISILLGFSLILQPLQLIRTFTVDQTLAMNLYIMAQVIEAIILLDAVFLFEMFETDRLLSKATAIFSALFFITFGILITKDGLTVSEVDGFYNISYDRDAYFNLFKGLFALGASFWLLRYFINSRKTLSNAKQRRLMNWLFTGLFLSQFIGSFIPIAMDNYIAGIDLLSLRYITILQYIGLVIIGFGFLSIQKEPWLIQRQKVKLLMVYSKDGMNLYTKTFDKELNEGNLHILTGAVSAITSIFQ